MELPGYTSGKVKKDVSVVVLGGNRKGVAVWGGGYVLSSNLSHSASISGLGWPRYGDGQVREPLNCTRW